MMYASRNFFTSACVAVMWRIPPPNSRPSFEVSAIFPLHEIGDISSMVIGLSSQSRNCRFYCLCK